MNLDTVSQLTNLQSVPQFKSEGLAFRTIGVDMATSDEIVPSSSKDPS